MQSYGELKNEILDDLNMHSQNEIVSRVERLIQKQYFKICRKVSISSLRDTVELDFTTADDTGLLLPSNLFGIDRIRDETNDVEFFMRDQSEIQPDEYGYRAYRYHPSRDPWLRGADLNLSKSAATFTSTIVDNWVTAGNSVDGEFLKVATEPGYYEIDSDTSPYDILDTYYGKDMVQAEFMIRPPETTRLVLTNASETILKDRTVKVFYWSAPRPLYNDNDTIVLPDATVLKLKVMREMPEAKKRRPVSQTEIEEAMAEMKKLNPEFPREQAPRDKHNNLFTFKQNLYKQRG